MAKKKSKTKKRPKKAKKSTSGSTNATSVKEDPAVLKLTEFLNRGPTEAWRALRNKLDSILLSGNALKSSEVQQLCAKLDGMTYDQRREHIVGHWGPQFLDRSLPLLHQLQVLESQ